MIIKQNYLLSDIVEDFNDQTALTIDTMISYNPDTKDIEIFSDSGTDFYCTKTLMYSFFQLDNQGLMTGDIILQIYKLVNIRPIKETLK